MKIVFLGTPEFALPSLKALYENNFEISLVITQPDKPVGRGHKIIACPVKQFAQQKQIPVWQPLKLRQDLILIQKLKSLQPDLMITAAFGQIISEEIIQIPKWGIWNIHASLLPRWRGAAPINWAIWAGDQQTGITIMQTEKGLDTGPILSKKAIPIETNDNAETLSFKLANLGAELLIETINQRPQPQAQNDLLATKAPKLTKEMGKIDWLNAKEIYYQVKALNPWPMAFFKNSKQETIKVLEAEYSESERKFDKPHILDCKNKLLIACQKGILQIQTIQPPNKAQMSASDWLRGLKNCSENFIEGL